MSRNVVQGIWGGALLFWSAACTATQPQSTPSVATTEPVATQVTAVSATPMGANERAEPACAAPADGATPERHKGVLSYSEPPRTMSVEAYQHVEFSLQTNERKLSLVPSPSVLWEQLSAARDRQVAVCCVWRAGAKPDPHEAAPMGPDGQPLPRPAKCEVVSLTHAER